MMVINANGELSRVDTGDVPLISLALVVIALLFSNFFWWLAHSQQQDVIDEQHSEMIVLKAQASPGPACSWAQQTLEHLARKGAGVKE